MIRFVFRHAILLTSTALCSSDNVVFGQGLVVHCSSNERKVGEPPGLSRRDKPAGSPQISCNGLQATALHRFDEHTELAGRCL